MEKSAHVAQYAVTSAADESARNSLIEKLESYAGIVDDKACDWDGFHPLKVQFFEAKTGEKIVEIEVTSWVKFTARISPRGNTEVTGEYWNCTEIVRAEFNDMPAFELWAEGYAEAEMEFA